MLRGLYDWTLSLAARKSAEWWLAFIAFVESSVFLVPADVLFLPMALSRPDRAYRYALIATSPQCWAASPAGSSVTMPMRPWRGRSSNSTASIDEFEALRISSGVGFIILMLVTSGLAHLPPIKVVTILSGVIGVPLRLFIVLGDRGARRPLPVPGLAAAPLWRADPAFHRKASWPDCKCRRRCPDFALRYRQICDLIQCRPSDTCRPRLRSGFGTTTWTERR